MLRERRIRGRDSHDNEVGKDTESGEDEERDDESDEDPDHDARGSNGSFGLAGESIGGTKFISENEALKEEANKSDGGEKKGGRRKINIEFIDNKSRRHVTFSKRKAGLIKKAYELSTLTGTQVLLLVASETGNVYTFATPKLQPLITKPEGKSLIQACLNPSESSGPSAPSAAASQLQQQQQQAPQTPAAQAAAQQAGRAGDGNAAAYQAATDRSKMAALIEQQQRSQAQQQQQKPQQGYPTDLNSLYNNPAAAAHLAQLQHQSLMAYPLGNLALNNLPPALQSQYLSNSRLPPPFPSYPFSHAPGGGQPNSLSYFPQGYPQQSFQPPSNESTSQQHDSQ